MLFSSGGNVLFVYHSRGLPAWAFCCRLARGFRLIKLVSPEDETKVIGSKFPNGHLPEGGSAGARNVTQIRCKNRVSHYALFFGHVPRSPSPSTMRRDRGGY